MLFRKLFRLLVVSGAVIGGSTGCASASAQTQQGGDQKQAARDGGTPPDAGATAGSGVQGW
jgi:hypothetical protein